MKVRDVLKPLADDGLTLKNQKGIHRQFIHPAKPGKVTVAGHPAFDLDPRTKNPILKQAGIK